MNIKVQFPSKTKVSFLLHLFLAGIFSLTLGFADAGRTLEVVAQGLAQGATPATNDTFPGTTILAIPFSDLNVDATAATTDVTDPTPILYGDCNSNEGFGSVWYNYTPSGDVDVAFDTIGSDYDTVLVVWKGSLENLTLVACNDDLTQDGEDLSSQVGFSARAGITYYIEVIEFAEPAPQAQAGGIRTLNLHAYEPTGAGTYDDTDSHWSYTGSWSAGSGFASAFGATLHYTGSVEDSASFAFSGSQFNLKYTQDVNRGNILVYVDGKQIGVIHANGALAWQQTYTSPIFPPGTHFVRFKHNGGGDYIDIDALDILNTAAPGAGDYDDTHANWSYTGSWASASGFGGASGGTLHYTGFEEDSAAFTFSGTQFILTYTQDTNRGDIVVNVDGIQTAVVHANGAFQWQKTYTSPVYPAGTHFVQFKHGGGGAYIDVDALKILNTAAPGAGKYDDLNWNWSYTGSWASAGGFGGASGGTLHYTGTVGEIASFTFSGTQFILTYTQDTNRGDIDVYVDDNFVTTINANGAFQWQKVYISPTYTSGTHFVQFKHGGGLGSFIDLDALEVLDGAASGLDQYDDTDANWYYTGAWASASSFVGAFDNTLHYTGTVGDLASFTFNGSQFTLTYTQDVNRGNILVYVDGSQVAVIHANGAFHWQSTYTSPIYPLGNHVVQFRHGGGGGAYIDLDALQILNTAAPGGPQNYDDIDWNWSYTGGWASDSNFIGASDNTLHYTGTVGEMASFTFSGTQFVLTYTQDVNRGNIVVYVDGTQTAVIHANGAFQWQKLYTSPVYPAGTHFVQFKHGGGGAFIDLDSIEVYNTAAPGADNYDDTHANWSYTGSWVAASGFGGASGGTLHYTGTIGAVASFTFSGTQFILTYTQDTNRGYIDVYVDDNFVTTIDANGAFQWQKTYTSPTYTSGTHFVEFKYGGGYGPYIDLDALEVK